MAINTRNLIKEDLLQAGGNAPPAVMPNTVDHRKEDPILLEELIKMAEQLANKGSTEVTWGEDDGPEIKRSDRFPTELGGELSGLRDALAVTQKQSKAAHEELLKAFQNSRSPAPAQGEKMGHKLLTARIASSTEDMVDKSSATAATIAMVKIITPRSAR
ncbi:hypothetical protein B0H14DRAFT_2576497 [Mycena olivaceomarginata]|nr:hypothetical protein B0H14DRAFT_2576497 [Mycena olivaceomarginata]